MRAILTALILICLAPPAWASSELLGIWDIEVTGGTANGDVGVIVIREENGALVGELEYHDADARVTAQELCDVREARGVISITCKVLSPISSDYWPDDFNLRLVSPNRMEGRLHSATGGPAVFIRREVPMS